MAVDERTRTGVYYAWEKLMDDLYTEHRRSAVGVDEFVTYLRATLGFDVADGYKDWYE